MPERIAENHFLEEIATLPCIVGGVGESSGSKAAELFEVFGTEIAQTTPVQAELAKIWTNILRYTQFALPNLLMMECEQYGANVFDVIDLINHDYPRGGMAVPGLTAGACLRKDFTFSEERSSAPGMLLAVSRVHETVPLFIVKGLKSRLGGSLRDLKVAVLGLTFKRDSDDMRDSLSYKLVRHARARAGARGAPRPARARRVGAARRRCSRAPTRWSWPRTTPPSRTCSSACRRARCSWTRGTSRAPAPVFDLVHARVPAE